MYGNSALSIHWRRIPRRNWVVWILFNDCLEIFAHFLLKLAMIYDLWFINGSFLKVPFDTFY